MHITVLNRRITGHPRALAKAIDEARVLVEAGFEYVMEIEGVRLLRKRK